MRAAAFGLGCLQELDEQHEVMRGEHAARYLAAVSGGSYTAAAVSLVLASEDDGFETGGPGRTFGRESEEARVLARDCDYFVRDGVLRILGEVAALGVLSLITVVSLVLFLPTVAGMAGGLGLIPSGDDDVVRILGAAGIAVTALITLWAVRSEPADPPRSDASLRLLLGLAAIALTAPSTAVLAERVPWLGAPGWWTAHLAWVAAGCLAVGVGAAAVQWARRETVPAPTAKALAAGAALAVLYRSLQLVYVLASLWFAAAVVDYSGPVVPIVATLVLVFAGFALFFGFSDATSLHHFYATRVASCFGVLHRWNASWTPARMLALPLSTLHRRTTGLGERPELLICAAANLRAGKAPVASMVFSPEEVQLHAAGGTSVLPTAAYERFTYPHRGELENQRSVLSLFRAVGLSGAAASPSMGFMTVRAARGVLSLLNARLGRWMPNPADPVMRDLSEQPGTHPVLPTARDALRELWGHHPTASALVYVTDGGHYENLGLVELLRRRCRLVIAVDSSGPKAGATNALEHSIAVATQELGVRIDLDVERFHRSDGPSPEIERCWALGGVEYRDGTRADLLVIRIGVDRDTPEQIVRDGRAASKFPLTSTLDQRYNADKFGAYVALGRSSTRAALAAPEVAEAFERRMSELPGSHAA